MKGEQMQIAYKVNNNLEVRTDFKDQKELWQQLASLEEVFGIKQCGKCGGLNLKHIVRHVEGYDFFELCCLNSKCRARLSFGQHKGDIGSLFPKRKDDYGNYLPNGGWLSWNPDKKIME